MNDMDVIRVYKSADSSMPKSKWRWTRRSFGNNKIIASSSEGYSRKEAAMRNVKRTQLGPYLVIFEEDENE